MSITMADQCIAAATGLMLLTAILQLWRRSVSAAITLLGWQSLALAALVATVGLVHHHSATVVMAILIALVKGVLIPFAMHRTHDQIGAAVEGNPRLSPAAALLAAAGLIMVAYLVSAPLARSMTGVGIRVLPIGIALVLLGYLMIVTRRRALSQLIGFVVVDNGIATVALLIAGGLPMVVELGALVDVVASVLVLLVLATRVNTAFGDTSLDSLRELHD